MFEKTLLSNLVFNEDFTRKTLPFIKPDFFRNRDEVALFNIISNFVVKYNNLPTKEAIAKVIPVAKAAVPTAPIPAEPIAIATIPLRVKPVIRL